MFICQVNNPPMNNDEQVILDIQVRYDDAIKKIADYSLRIDDLRASNQLLRKEMKEEGADRQKLSQQIVLNNEEINKNQQVVRLLTKEIRDNISEEKQKEGSVKSLRKELSALTSDYNTLSATERKSADGKELQNKILAVRTELEAAEQAIGDFRRNVGNYEESFAKALEPMKKQLVELASKYNNLTEAEKRSAQGKEMLSQISSMDKQLKNTSAAAGQFQNQILSLIGVNNSFLASINSTVGGLNGMPAILNSVKVGIMGVGKSLLALLANPVVAIIAAIAAAVTALVAIFSKMISVAKGNEEQFSKLQVIMAPINFIVDKITNAFEELADVFLTVASAVMKGIVAFSDFIGITDNLKGKTEEYIQVEKDKLQLAKDTRKANEDAAQSELKVSELRDKVAQKDKFTHEQRIGFLDEAIALEKKTAEEKKRLAEENLRLLTIEGDRTKNSAEFEEKLSQARIAVTRATTDLNNKTRELNAQRSEAVNAMKSETKAEQEKAKQLLKQKEEQKQKEIELIRQQEDIMLSFIKEGTAKQRTEIQLRYDRQIADLKQKLETDKTLTKQARQTINETIALLDKQRYSELDKISDEALASEIDKETKRIQLRLDAVKSGTQQEHDLQIHLIEQNRIAELEANKRLSEELRQSEADINAKYRQQEADANEAFRKAQYDKQSEALRLEWENKLLQVTDGSLQEYDLKIQQAQAEHDALINMDEATKVALFESQAAYENAVLQSEANMQNAMNARNQVQAEAVSIQLQAAQKIGEGFSSVLEAFADDNEALAVFAKTIALFNVGLNTAEAISKGVAAAQSVPFPGNIAAVATTISTVMANIVKAKQLLSKEKQPKAPEFSTGGDIIGPAHSSGGVTIEAEGGEAIINKRSMANPLLRSIASAVNVAGGGVPFAGAMQAISSAPVSQPSVAAGIDIEALKSVVVEALKEMPAPVVSVVEITDKQNRIKAIERGSLS